MQPTVQVHAPAAAESLEQRVFQLETLYEIGRECARVERVEDALRIVLSMVMGAFGATGGRIRLEDGTGHTIAAFARGGDPTATTVDFTLEDGGRGAIALAPRLSGEPYSAEDSALLETIAANAAVHLRRLALVSALTAASAALQRKVGALAVVNEIALGFGGHPSAQRLRRFLLEKIAAALCAAEATFIAAEQTTEQTAAHTMTARIPGDAGTDGTNGSAILVRRDTASPPFDGEDRALLQLLANEVGVVLENSRLFDTYLTQQQEQFRLRGVLEQYLAPAVAERLIAGTAGETGPAFGGLNGLKGAHRRMSLVRVDMRASTELVNLLDVDSMIDLMNEYIGRMVDVLFRYEGTIDRFDGDAVIGFFGAPEPHDDDPIRAVCTGLAMLRAFATLRAQWATRHPLPARLGIGVGVASGDAVVGNIGSAKRLHYTVSGVIANLAARLMGHAPAGHMLVNEAAWLAAQEPLRFPAALRARRPRYIRAKGFPTLVPVYRLRPADLPHLAD